MQRSVCITLRRHWDVIDFVCVSYEQYTSKKLNLPYKSSVEKKVYIQLTHSRTPHTGSMDRILAYDSSDTLISPIDQTLPYNSSIEMKFYVQLTHSHTPYTGSMHCCTEAVHRLYNVHGRLTWKLAGLLNEFLDIFCFVKEFIYLINLIRKP